ncbi:MAG: hypothetical protein WBK76_03005 [Candidatus Saccharimonadales bacterium]
MLNNSITLKSRAFTIVELLIIVVVIGILALITFLAFTGIQTKAATASVKSDLVNASRLIENYRTVNGQYPPDLTTVNNGNGFTASKGNTVEYTSGSTSTFCATVSRGSIAYRQSNGNFESLQGACPGHGPALPAEIVEYNVANYPNTSTLYTLPIATTIQPTDILVTILKEHYAVWDAYVSINGTQAAPKLTKSIGTGAKVMDITVNTGINPGSNITLMTDGSNVELSYYVIRGVRNPSALTTTVAGWVGDGDDGVKSSGFIRTIPAQNLKAGQVAILAVDVLSASGVTFPYNASPAANQWTVNNAATIPLSASLIGTSSASTPVQSSILISGSNYVAGALLILGN